MPIAKITGFNWDYIFRNVRDNAIKFLQGKIKKLDSFKIYVRDTGLIMSMYETGIQKDILNSNLYINEGGIEHYPLFMIMFI